MIRKISAVTLVELIIATLIVSMVIAGVFSAEYALRRTNENGSGDTQTAIQTKSLADAVRSAVKALHGDSGNHGITILLPVNTQKTICFRHDIVVGADFTPADYTDDSHTCFTQIGTTVYRCERLPAAACSNADLLVGMLVADQFTNAIITAQGPMVVVVDTGLYAFRMLFVGRRDPAANAAVTAGSLTSGTDANPQTMVRVFETAGF
jgi:hypothetical protein